MPQPFLKRRDLSKSAVLCYITVHCLKFYFVGLLTLTAIICHPRLIPQHFDNCLHLQTTSSILTLWTHHAVMIKKYSTLSGLERGHTASQLENLDFFTGKGRERLLKNAP